VIGNVTLVLIGGDSATRTGQLNQWKLRQLVDPKKARVISVLRARYAGGDADGLGGGEWGGDGTKKVDVRRNGRGDGWFDSLDVPFGESKCAVKIDSADGFQLTMRRVCR